MSIEDLQADLSANLAEAKNLSALSTIGDVTNHLKNTLWPFLENLTGEIVEMDASLEDMYNQQEDVLRFETGKQLMATIAGAKVLIDNFKTRVAGDANVLHAIAEWEKSAHDSARIIEEITLPEEAEEDDEDADADDDDDDGDDDEDDDDDADGDDGDDDDDQEGTTPQ